MARPSRYTPDLVSQIATLVRLGVPAGSAAASLGIPVDTYYQWLRRHKALREAVERARSECEAVLVGEVRKAAKTSWRAATWLLEREYPENWAPVSERGEMGDQLDRELDRILAK